MHLSVHFLSLLFQQAESGFSDIYFPNMNFPDFLLFSIFLTFTKETESMFLSIPAPETRPFRQFRGGYPHVRAVLPCQNSSEFLSMLYNELMTGRTGLMNGMTRQSPALRGMGENCVWHRQGNRAHGARARRGQQPWPGLCRPPAPILPTVRHISTSSAPLRARPPAPIMSGRAARTDRHHEETTP